MPSLAFFNSSSKCCCLQTGQFHILPPNNPITGFIGEDVILPCQLSLTVFPRSITVQWVALQPFRTLKEISYNEAVKDSWLEERSWGGTELFLSQWSTGNLSLKLKNAQVPDKGKYICRVTAGQWHDQVAIELEVTDTKPYWISKGEGQLRSLLTRIQVLTITQALQGDIVTSFVVMCLYCQNPRLF
uniref:Ig-like domain-containing protein n=1 Tax=Aquila chrysaetos chrysaetos TaxID=223781 RepID=A0A663EYW2_AQUCH